MKEIVNRLQENRQIELAKSIVEAAGYTVTKVSESEDIKEDTSVSNSGCAAYPSDSENDPIMLKLGDDYPIFLSIKIENREEAEKVYNTMSQLLSRNVADAVDYCMRRGFSISYNDTRLYP